MAGDSPGRVTGAFPDVRYADADGVSIAYCVRGNGPLDLVLVPGNLASALSCTVDPFIESWLARLAGFSRVIQLDRRGLGMSDPLVAGGAPPLEQQVADVLAVMDAVGSDRPALYGSADAGMVAMLFAAMHPDRVRALVLQSGWARATEGLTGSPQEVELARAKRSDHIRAQWGDLEHPWGLRWLAPSRLADPEFPRTLARVQQVCGSRAAIAQTMAASDHDVSAALPLIQAPTLVTCQADCAARLGGLGIAEHAQYLTERIPNARLSLTRGTDIYPGVGFESAAEHMEEFLTGTRAVPVSDRVLATVLFTDIVGSTEQLAALGDHAWRDRLDGHDAMVRTHLERFRGREVNTTGDGFLAVFDGPARAVQCAQAVAGGAGPLGIQVRAGVHVGECEVRGDDLAGIAVHIGARVCALAQPGEVLTTSTVRDLVAGSGITFTERGRHTLKGIPGEWAILAAEA
jgi:class 3 adenylate cyclase/pimeloyl-ACP methyl ester carboxylesterase